MKAKDIRDLTADEIAVKIRENKEEILNLRVQQQSGQLENPTRLRTLRREIAQFETILTEKSAATAAE